MFEAVQCDATDCEIETPHWVVYHDSGVGISDHDTPEEAAIEAARLNAEEGN